MRLQDESFQGVKTQHAYFYDGLEALDIARWSHLLTKDMPFWILSASSFFAFSRPALQDSDV
jgi:hypothetical protein